MGATTRQPLIQVNGEDGKVCNKCSTPKPLTEFYKQKSGRFGRLSNCKRCYYIRNQKTAAARFARERDRVKREVLAAYGNICYCCGEDNPKLLTLDHEFDDGGKYRSANPKLKRGGRKFYYWLRQHGYPQDLGLRVACWNCNCGRQYNSNKGVCPHQEELQALTGLRLVA